MTTNWNRLRGSVTLKLAVIAAIGLVMLIPLKMVEGLIVERSGARSAAARAVAQSWGNPQTVGGPIVIVPFRYDVLDRQGVSRRVSDELHLLPRELRIEGGADMQVLRRGIYEIPVYSASLSVTGTLRPIPDFGASLEGLEVLWNEAEIALPLADPRSLRNPVAITVAGTALEFEPGSADIAGLGPMLRAPLADLDRALFDAPQPFALDLMLAGTGSLDFRPDGDTTRVEIASGWPSPSFRGAWLPESRDVSADGFDAAWQVLALGRGYPATWFASDGRAGAAIGALSAGALSAAPVPPTALPRPFASAGFGVDFLVPVDVHTSSLRAIRYAVLYLAVTFAAFFLFEIFSGTRLHPVQYLSVGLANGIFYLLLLALAEHAGFGAAYVASATASTALVGGYAAAILGSTRRALPMAGLLAGLYLYLYTTLRAEDYALLVGALGLFGLLTAFMYVTRGVDWYAIELAGDGRANPADGAPD